MRGVVTHLIQVIISCSHRLNAVGRNLGATSSQGGAWGLLKSLQQNGPQTIPELAQSRPVSRQHMRQLAQSLIQRGWIASETNPAHKRSFLLRLTPAGEQAVHSMDEQIETTLGDWLRQESAQEITTTHDTLTRLAERLQRELV